MGLNEEEIINYLNYEGFINNGDYINNGLFNKMKNYNHNSVAELFVKNKEEKQTGWFTYKLEIDCKQCGLLYLDVVSKSKFLKRLKDGFICQVCDTKNKIENKIEQDKKYVNYKDSLKEKYVFFIENYLNSNRSRNKGINPYFKYTEILNNIFNIENEVKQFILNMDYKDFLQTPYRKGIAEYKKKSCSYKCMICGLNNNLNIHHNSYENHGLEHNRNVFKNDLICICNNCHNKHHN